MILTSCPVGPENRRWQCWQRSVSWRTTCRNKQRQSAWTCGFTSVSVCVFELHMCEHSLSLVVSERDPLCRNLEVDDGGRRRGVHGECQRGRLLNRLMSRQRLQLHRAQVPHVTRYKSNMKEHTKNRTVQPKLKIKLIIYWLYSLKTELRCIL